MQTDCVTIALYSGFSVLAERLPAPDAQSHSNGHHGAVWFSGNHKLTIVFDVRFLREKRLWVDAEFRVGVSYAGYTASVACTDLLTTENGVKRLDALVGDFLRVVDSVDKNNQSSTDGGDTTAQTLY